MPRNIPVGPEGRSLHRWLMADLSLPAVGSAHGRGATGGWSVGGGAGRGIVAGCGGGPSVPLLSPPRTSPPALYVSPCPHVPTSRALGASLLACVSFHSLLVWLTKPSSNGFPPPVSEKRPPGRFRSAEQAPGGRCASLSRAAGFPGVRPDRDTAGSSS